MVAERAQRAARHEDLVWVDVVVDGGSVAAQAPRHLVDKLLRGQA